MVAFTATQPHELEDPVVQGEAGYLAPPEEVLPPGHGHPGEHHHGDRLGDRRQVLCPHEVLRGGEANKRNVVRMAARAPRGEAGTRGMGARRGRVGYSLGVGLITPSRPLDACTVASLLRGLYESVRLSPFVRPPPVRFSCFLFWADLFAAWCWCSSYGSVPLLGF